MGVQKLLLVYPAKVCKYCSEVHIGPSGHKARLCGVFKFESYRGTHFWQKADVDDLVPPKIVWRRRPQDPAILLDEGREFYGHAPAIVDLCAKAGGIVPKKYHCMMKHNGLSAPLNSVKTPVG
uniref:APO domain-containing protein n=1 Tax=Rhizophora mucronata TaxID=61149 RepID=A0A2P2P1X0_RHIMU